MKYKKQYTVTLDFAYEIDKKPKMYVIRVPENVSEYDVIHILREEHDNLDRKKADRDYYGEEGRDSDTLIWYVCQKHDWPWKQFEPDIEIRLP